MKKRHKKRRMPRDPFAGMLWHLKEGPHKVKSKYDRKREKGKIQKEIQNHFSEKH